MKKKISSPVSETTNKALAKPTGKEIGVKRKTIEPHKQHPLSQGGLYHIKNTLAFSHTKESQTEEIRNRQYT